MARNDYKLTQTGQEVQDAINKIIALGPATHLVAGTMTAEDKAKLDALGIFYGTTEYWNSQYDFVPEPGQIIIYSDYTSKEVNGQTIYFPGIKIGSGNSYVQDLTFVGQDKADDIASILGLIPQAASTSNQLADKAYVDKAVARPFLYVGDELTDEQKAHNLALIQSWCEGDGLIHVHELVVNIRDAEGGGYLGSDFPITVFQAHQNGNTYTVLYRFCCSLFLTFYWISSFQTEDGSLDPYFFSGGRHDTIMLVKELSFPVVGNENEETPLDELPENVVTYNEYIDLAFDINYLYRNNLSYGRNDGEIDGRGYYEVYFNEHSRIVRLRVYSDDTATTLWYYRADVTPSEKTFWNNKINVNDSQEVVNGTLIFTRG